MSTQLPITPSVLRWARNRSGYSIEELEATKQFARIRLWECENSDVYPTYRQLEKLAGKFKVPVAVFFFPEPPVLPSINETFRTVESTFFENLPPRIYYLLRKAKAFQLSLSELNADRPRKETLITKRIDGRTTNNFMALANQVRDYLNISIDQQLSWDDESTAFSEWRSALGSVGVNVFKDQFRVAEYSGFCLFDDLFPIIYVNNSNTKTRQIFTLFHELAHLIFQTSGIDYSRDHLSQVEEIKKSNIEIDCNKFAASVLVPDDVFERYYDKNDISDGSVTKIAKIFNVSRELVFRKILEKKHITQEEYKNALYRWNAQMTRKKSGGDYYRNVITYLGKDFIKLAFSNYYQNNIDKYELAEHLNIKPKHLEKIEEYYMNG